MQYDYQQYSAPVEQYAAPAQYSAPAQQQYYPMQSPPSEPSSDMPTSDRTASPQSMDDVAALGNPRQVLKNEKYADLVSNLLKNSSTKEHEAIITWMLKDVKNLALDAKGTRVVQTALEVTGREDQIRLSKGLCGHVIELMESLNGNHVLQKAVTYMPPYTVGFIVGELANFSGGWAAVAKHQFG